MSFNLLSRPIKILYFSVKLHQNVGLINEWDLVGQTPSEIGFIWWFKQIRALKRFDIDLNLSHFVIISSL